MRVFTYHFLHLHIPLFRKFRCVETRTGAFYFINDTNQGQESILRAGHNNYEKIWITWDAVYS